MGGFSSEFRPAQKGHRNGKVLKWWARRVEKWVGTWGVWGLQHPVKVMSIWSSSMPRSPVYIYIYTYVIYIYMMMILEPPTKMVDNKPPRGCGVSLHISIPPAPKKKKNTLHTVILKKCLRDSMWYTNHLWCLGCVKIPQIVTVQWSPSPHPRSQLQPPSAWRRWELGCRGECSPVTEEVSMDENPVGWPWGSSK